MTNRTPNSEELLRRDIRNVLQFFKKFDIEESEEDLFEEITN
ncbi:MAG: RIO1 family regulatory kinase/ATPase [Candidatus Woesearchaeota archaeon]